MTETKDFEIVQRTNGSMNFIKTDGTFLSKEWFKWVEPFSKGFAFVEREDGSMNFIKTDGTFLCKEWFEKEKCKNLIYLGNDEVCSMPQGTYIIDKVPSKSTYWGRNLSNITISETFESPAEEVMEELYIAVEAYFRKKFG